MTKLESSDMQKFSSKIILFGEYAVLKGAKLLAIPFNKYKGKLVIPSKNTILTKEQNISNHNIFLLFNHIQKQTFHFTPDLKRFNQNIIQNIYFSSNIPQNYGVGSSGALVASIYNQYFFNRNQLIESSDIIENIKNDLALIESFFHGKSSGSDPLVSYLNKALIINGESMNQLKHPETIIPFIINTGQSSSTQNFVNLFEKNTEFNKNHLKRFIELNNIVIDHYLANKPHLFNRIIELAEVEKSLIPEMFIKPKNLETIEFKYKNELAIKLCGSGGGGFLLGFVKKTNSAEIFKHFEKLNIPTIRIV